MALRIDHISLTRASPIGAVSISPLASGDLVIIVGPNGAGKTTITKLLDSNWHAPKYGALQCVDSSNGVRDDVRAKDVSDARELTFVPSMALMTKFQGLRDSLSLAAQASRDLDVADLAAAAIKCLQPANNDVRVAEPPEVAQLRPSLLDADSRLEALSQGAVRPRTMAEYERLGAALAQRKGVQWTAPSLSPTAERQKAQEVLRPERVTLAGLDELRNAVAPLKDVPSPDQSAASTLDAARAECREAIDNAVKIVPAVAEASSDDVADYTNRVIEGLGKAHDAVTKTLMALDSLRECRLAALKYLEVPAHPDTSACDCPVCAQSITRSSTIASLKGHIAAASITSTPDEHDMLSTRRQEIEQLKGSLESARTKLMRATSSARDEHGALCSTFGSFSRALAPAQHWSQEVREKSSELKAQCADWLSAHGGAPSRAAVDMAYKIAAAVREAMSELQRSEDARNQGLDAARREFDVFERLGTLLELRQRLDSIQWSIDMEQADRNRRRLAQMKVWIDVLASLEKEHRNRASDAARQVVDDPGVRDRFGRMVQRITAAHPQWGSIMLGQDNGKGSLRSGNEDCSDRLSEGQRVLVNIAATVAVAGKVFEDPEGRAGWLVFDEPTNGLDVASREAVAEYLGSITNADLPRQIFVTTFDERFAEALEKSCQSTGDRHMIRINLERFVPEQQVRPRIHQIGRGRAQENPA